MSDTLSNLSDALAGAVKTAGAFVVRVEARRRLASSGIIWSEDGLIITSHHGVERDENINVGLSDGNTVSAALVGRDPTTDVALLRAQTKGLPMPTWAMPDQLEVGHLVLALGRPQQSILATMGIISALNKEAWRAPTGGRLDSYLQTDAVMYPGFSGGPLVGVDGQIIGLTTSALLQGISLTIATPTLRRVVEALLAHGRVRQGYLGIGSQAVRLPGALSEQLNQETGLLLVSVEPGSPAEKGNLMLGDILVGIESQSLRHLDDLLAALNGDRVGQKIALRIVRGGQIQEQKVVVGERG